MDLSRLSHMHKGFFDELYCAKTNVPDEFRAYRTFPPDAGPTFTGEEKTMRRNKRSNGKQAGVLRDRRWANGSLNPFDSLDAIGSQPPRNASGLLVHTAEESRTSETRIRRCDI